MKETRECKNCMYLLDCGEVHYCDLYKDKEVIIAEFGTPTDNYMTEVDDCGAWESLAEWREICERRIK